ncbi:hypothetical protein J2S25_001528 [Mesobacillus stamsii]|uniref:Uncharacterized protein n=1 Tax=Mesobacillus stamsii TaxID=225347 RepID=A0ABU0FU54_9BACI|nr:hypothetical protein [Mesobacillus stamsii]
MRILKNKLDLLRSLMRLMMNMRSPCEEVPTLDELPFENQFVGKVKNGS